MSNLNTGTVFCPDELKSYYQTCVKVSLVMLGTKNVLDCKASGILSMHKEITHLLQIKISLRQRCSFSCACG